MRILSVLLLLVPLTLTAGEVYKWTDEKGRVHYGDKPGGDNAKKLAVKPGSGDGGVGAAEDASAIEALKMADQKYADCKKRRAQVADWKAAGKIVEKDGLGREKAYSDDEKRQLISQAETAIQKDCAGV